MLRLVFLQNPPKLLSWILDMLWSLVRLCQNLHKVTEGIFLNKLFCDIGKSA
jgi:hypothetical protein